MRKPSFLKDHSDTLAIIGVNLAAGAILLSICLTNIASVNSANARMDTLHVLIYDLLKEVRK